MPIKHEAKLSALLLSRQSAKFFILHKQELCHALTVRKLILAKLT